MAQFLQECRDFGRANPVFGCNADLNFVGLLRAKTIPMRTKANFKDFVGYYSLPFSMVPLLTVTFLNCMGYMVPMVFGAIGFFLAISGLWCGRWQGRICALFSLLIFLHLGLGEFAYKANF